LGRRGHERTIRRELRGLASLLRPARRPLALGLRGRELLLRQARSRLHREAVLLVDAVERVGVLELDLLALELERRRQLPLLLVEVALQYHDAAHLLDLREVRVAAPHRLSDA